jgi:GH15 family glucan-1,4-alpha-glucosidase
MSMRIEDYALIGDCQTAALVGSDGSIDWLCFPRFDSQACFAALLGTRDNGRWQIAPVPMQGAQGHVRAVRRRYREGTLVLETDFETADGAVTLIDFMPLRDEAPDVVRIVEGKRGKVPMRMELTIRFDYGSAVPWVRKHDASATLRATAGPDTLYFRSGVGTRGQDMRTTAEFTVSAGQRLPFSLTWAATRAAEPAPVRPEDALRETGQWWRDWSGRCQYQGPWREAVLRSLITLQAMTYSPTGGIVAAPTTSLPEQIGGVRNWDYRYCWLRDATFTLYSLMNSGYTEEAKAWRQWLVDAVAGNPEDLQIMYGVAGERRLTEIELDGLAGYEGSKPVRVGNGAYKQHQLDVYGEVMDAMYAARRLGLPPDDQMWKVQRLLVDFLETKWPEPDAGIWEVRGPHRQFTQSKVMAWVAMDRAVKSVEQLGRKGDAAKWRRARDRIHEQVCHEGFNPKLKAFTQYYGADDADASLLLMPLVGFLPATDPRVLGTVELVRKQLMHDGFLRRYPAKEGGDGLPAGEGAFLLCTFWLADNLSLQGRKEEAREIFERLLALRNDVGLLSEEYDPTARRLVGNFPQAFSHVGLINTARNLAAAGGPAEHRGG